MKITFRELAQEDEQIEKDTFNKKIESVPTDERFFDSIELVYDLRAVLTEEEFEICKLLSQNSPIEDFSNLWGIKDKEGLYKKLNYFKAKLREKLQFLIN